MILMRLIFLLFFFITASFAKEKVSLQLLWLDQFQFAGYYIAKEKGFYKEAGLDVELKKYSERFNKQRSIVDDVVEGIATYGIGRSNLVVDRSKGEPIIALAAIYQSSPLMLLGLKSSGLQNISDIKNKKIMLTNSLASTTSIKAMLFSNGISLDDNEVIPHSFNVEDLINKKADLIAAYVSNEPFLLEQKGIFDYKTFSPRDEGYDFYSDILFTSKKEMDKNPLRVDKFLKASLKGWKYAFENMDEAVDIIYKKYNSQNKTKKALLYEAKKLKALAYQNTFQIGDMDIKKIQRIYDIYKIMGRAKGDIDFREFLYSFAKLNLTSEEKRFIKKFKKLRVHNEKAWPPYNYNEFGLPKGFSIDYMNLIAQKLGFDVEYVSNGTWNDYLKMIKNKNLDLMLNIVNTPERREYINFTNTYAQSLPSIFALNNRTNINNIKDLDGKTVAIPKGFYTGEVIRNFYPKINLIYTANMIEALEAVAFKKADATISDFAVANYLLKKHGIMNLKAITNIPDERFVSRLNIGVRDDLPILKNIIQKGMNNVKDEEIFILRDKWFGSKLNFVQKDIFFTQKEKEFLQKRRLIRICVDPNWSPYEYIVDKQHMGVTSDYIKYFSKVLDVPFQLIPTETFLESLQYIKDKECDLLPAVAMTLDRLNYINFTKPYLSTSYVLATSKAVKSIKSLSSLDGKKIGVVKGYALIDILKRKYPNIKIIEYSNIYQGLKDVEYERIFGFIDVSSAISAVISEKNLHDLKVSFTLKEKLDLAVGIRNDEPILLSILQKLLTSLSAKEKDLILKKWIAVKYEHEVDYSLIWSVFVPLIMSLVIIIFYLWNIKLKKEIKSKAVLAKRLNNSLEDFRQLVNSTIEAIFIIDKNGRCIEANDEAKKLFNFNRKADYIGRHIFFIVADEDKEFVRTEMRKNKSFPKEVNLVKNDGSIFPALVKGETARRIDQTVTFVSIVDLTELKQKEHLLFQQSKMALMGEMMSAIAHQWRQPLNALAALNMQVETKLEFKEQMTYDEYKPICESINNQLNYMSKTIDDFRDFFIPTKTKVEFSVCTVISDVIDILKPQLENNNIEYSFEFSDVYYTGFPNEFKQVIINILNNAKDAIVLNKIENGEIRVRVERIQNHINIYIRDNGGGISPKIIAKVFNPYFTTKFESKGTGIGLYMSKMIIEKSMGGELKVESSNGNTTFVISFDLDKLT